MPRVGKRPSFRDESSVVHRGVTRAYRRVTLRASIRAATSDEMCTVLHAYMGGLPRVCLRS